MAGKFYEELHPGDRFVSPGRTVTQADIVAFAGLSGDYNPIHTDDEFCKTTRFGRPIAHGLLVVSLLSGLVERTGIQEGTIVAMRRVRELVFSLPVFAGDTVHAELEVLEKEPRKEGGVVAYRIRGVNQDGKPVVELVYEALMKGRAP